MGTSAAQSPGRSRGVAQRPNVGSRQQRPVGETPAPGLRSLATESGLEELSLPAGGDRVSPVLGLHWEGEGTEIREQKVGGKGQGCVRRGGMRAGLWVEGP